MPAHGAELGVLARVARGRVGRGFDEAHHALQVGRRVAVCAGEDLLVELVSGAGELLGQGVGPHDRRGRLEHVDGAGLADLACVMELDGEVLVALVVLRVLAEGEGSSVVAEDLGRRQR